MPYPKVDKNQPEIVSALRQMGAEVFHVHMVKNFFDILVAYKGKLYAVEIKNGTKPESARKLTEGEERCKVKLEGVNVPYNVVTSVEEAIELISNELPK
jgi:uroporphyrinogen-III decarboxylase